MAWIKLIFAGLLEVFWSTMMKQSTGFSKFNYLLYTVLGMIASFYFLTKTYEFVLLHLDRYWCAWFSYRGGELFHDKLTPEIWFFVGLLLINIIGIKMTSGH